MMKNIMMMMIGYKAHWPPFSHLIKNIIAMKMMALIALLNKPLFA